MAKCNRLYVVGEEENFRFVTAENLTAARMRLGPDARIPNDDDVRKAWIVGEFHEKTPAVLRKLYGVSRQTISNWRARGGRDLPTFRKHTKRTKLASVHKVLTSTKRPTASHVASLTHSSVKLVTTLAEKLGIKLRGHRRMPEDAELIELQKGCTWHDLAIKTGLRISTLRNYVYARPELSKALRAVRKPSLTGPNAHGTFPKEKVRKMHLTGMTAHAIAETLRVEQMTVRYWIRKWSREAANDQSGDGREAGSAVGRSPTRNKRKQRRSARSH